MPMLHKWSPMRSMNASGQVLSPMQTAANIAPIASAWGSPYMGYSLSDAYNLGFSARAMGQNLSGQEWSAAGAGRPSGPGYISPYSPYRAATTWAPGLPGSGVRGQEGVDSDAIADLVLREFLQGS